MKRPFSRHRFFLHPATLAVLLLGGVDAALALRGRAAPSACDRPGDAACAMPAAEARADGPVAPALPDGAAVLEFTSEYCPACRKLEPVLEDARRQGLRAGPVVRIDVESASGGKLALHWGVTATPTLVFLDTQHAELARLVGAQPLADVRRAIERAYGLECASLPLGAASPG